MHSKSFCVYFAAGLILVIGELSLAAAPRVANDRYKLELVASDPQIATPIGMAFDKKGRLLVVESHTHLRPEGYKGPKADRIRMLSDSDGDGKLDRWSTFAEGFRQAMNLLVRDDGGVYVVTRHNVVLLYDTDGDGIADKQEEILRLETTDDYPHDGLAGIAEASGGRLLIGLGENHGKPYRLIHRDGTSVSGRDGAGCIFECWESHGPQRIATGFWNPFGICALPDGRVFAVDNDPDASPPCRMVHVIRGGDYGFRFQYGRAGTHPLQAWNGELPGTLPYVCGVGEAPTAIVALGKWLWVTSWGDHRIDRYELEPRGASYGAKRETIVQGDSDFRPTGMAVAPDGSLYFGDWVLKDYPVHGHGRIWRLTLPSSESKEAFTPRTEEDKQTGYFQRFGNAISPDSKDPFVFASGVYGLSREDSDFFEGWGTHIPERPMNEGWRLTKLEARRLRKPDNVESVLREALHDKSPDVRLFAVRWIADERIMALRDDLNALLEEPPPSRRYYLAVLGAIDWLSHEPKMTGNEIAGELLVRELKNDNRSPETHALALSLLNANDGFLSLDRLRDYLKSDHTPLRIEAVRSLSQQASPERFSLLAEVAEGKSQPDEVRVEAIVGLAAAAADHRELLERLAESDHPTLRDEARRSLRLAGLRPGPSEIKPPAADVAAWQKLLATGGNSAAGRRMFFNPVGARCYMCHSHAGRGGIVGPELTNIGSSTTRDKIVASIIQPSLEIAPDYLPWTLVTDDGKVYTGLRLPQPGDDGKEHYVDSAATEFVLPSESIAERHAAAKSIMPENLQATLSIADLRDIVTFLTTPATNQ